MTPEETIERVLSRWVRWIDLINTRRVGCVCGTCARCTAKHALNQGPEAQRRALVRLVDTVSFSGLEQLRPCDCRQCLECQARSALGGEEVTVADRKMTAVVGENGSVHFILKKAQELRSNHRRGNPMRCEDCGTVNRYWTGYAWRCTECKRLAKAAQR
jgi:hypothetical protein